MQIVFLLFVIVAILAATNGNPYTAFAKGATLVGILVFLGVAIAVVMTALKIFMVTFFDYIPYWFWATAYRVKKLLGMIKEV